MADTKAVMKFVTNFMFATKQYGRKRAKVEITNEEIAIGKDDAEKLELPIIPDSSNPTSREEICLKDVSLTQPVKSTNDVDSKANYDPVNEDDNNNNTRNDKALLDFTKNLINDDENDKDTGKDLVFCSEHKQANVENGTEHDESRDLVIDSTIQTVKDSCNQNDTKKGYKPQRGRKRKKLNSPIKSDIVNVENRKEINLFEECKDSERGTCELIKSSGGRKRKIFQNIECEKVYKAEKEVVRGTSQIVGRVLRSRTNVKNGSAEMKKEADLTDTELENAESHRPVEKRRKKGKGQRGRPPKNQGQIGVSVSKVISKKKIEINAPTLKKKVKLGKLKKKNVNRGSVMDRRGQKQIVSDQIAGMLIKAGWTIEHRPRKNRDCLDAVYVERDGKTHWSVTKAYNMFKEKIENGSADTHEVSAYTLIPAETLKILMRNSGGEPKKAKIKEKEKEKRKKGKKKKVDKLQNIQKVEKRRGRKPIALLARKSNMRRSDGAEDCSSAIGLISWMIDLSVLVIGSKVSYMNPDDKKILLSGQITKKGIHCDCCDQIVSTYGFMAHSGTNQRQVYNNICLESGISLLQCLSESWNKEMESFHVGFCHVDIDGTDPNDDTCNICGDGGHLFCCDGCPSTFHKSCLEIDQFPSGDWRCVYCSCKFCKSFTDCSAKDCSELHVCCMCEEKYHVMCTEVKDDSKDQFFCGKKCGTMFENLQNLLGIKQDLEDGYSWTLLQRFEIDEDGTVEKSRLKIESNSKLAVARSIMDECFMTIVDERSGSNMINNIIFGCGSNLKRLNYTGFVTAILERGDEIISAASIRIHGDQLAEMPFIGTRHMYRRQGMCRRLLSAIESALSRLDVKKLVIPAISELLDTWTSVFCFEQIDVEQRKDMKRLSMVVFPGVDMLQKSILKTSASGEEMVTDDITSVSPAVVLDESGANDAELSSGIGSDTTNSEDKSTRIDSDITNSDENAIQVGSKLTNCEEKATNFEDKTAEIESDMANLEDTPQQIGPKSADCAEIGIQQPGSDLTYFEDKSSEIVCDMSYLEEKVDLI